MEKNNERIKGMISAGIKQSLAETIAAVNDAFLASPSSFDKNYWLLRLERDGASEEMAQDVLLALADIGAFARKYGVKR